MNIHVFRDGGELKDAVLLMFRSEGTDWSEADLELARPFGLDPAMSFSGKAGRTRICSTPGGSCLLVGLGKADDLDLDGFRAAVGTAVRIAASQELSSLAVASEHLNRLELDDDLTLECVVAARLAGYRFVAFKSDPGEEDCPVSLAVWSQDAEMQEKVARALAVAEGVALARDLVNTPANVATPEHLAGVARDLGTRFGFGVLIFGPEEIVEMGMGSFASVFRGSDTPARFIVIDSAPGSDAQPLVFVGKGAAIGAAAGAGLGFLVGNEIAKRKQAYATTEEFLDAEISNTKEYNKTAIAYNAKLSKDVATLEKQSKTLRAQYDKGTVDKKVLAAKSDELQKKIDASKKLENTLAKELDVQTAILADEKKARPAGDQYVARLEKEVNTLQKNLDKLRDGSTQLAQIDQRLSV